MISGEQKICERCKQGFQCNAENITQCQCYGITISAAAKEYIASRFNDCLCYRCLQEIKEKCDDVLIS